MSSLSEILELVVSRDDLLVVSEVADKLESSLYRQGEALDYQQLEESSDNPELAKRIIRTFKDSEEKRTLIKHLNETLKNARVLRLSLAVNPNRAALEKIALWVKKNLGGDVILEWEIDPEVVAGAKIAFGGKYGDFSTATKLEEWWKGDGQEIRKALGYEN